MHKPLALHYGRFNIEMIILGSNSSVHNGIKAINRRKDGKFGNNMQGYKVARKFLYGMAIIIALVIAGGFAIRIFQHDLTAMAFVPETEFTEQKALATSIYDDPKMWYARGAQGNNPSDWQPKGAEKIEPRGPAAIFFIHPTSYIDRSRWNAPLHHKDSENRAILFLRGLASPFASAGNIWAPKYRQATIGAFLTKKPEGQAALDAAYRDVLQSFDHFLESQDAGTPIILAGHSQGARHLTYLLRDRVAGKPLAKQIVAAYVVGWPIALNSDLDALGLPLCENSKQTGCIMSWQSFAEPADYELIVNYFSLTDGFNGQSRRGSKILCSNPLTGGGNGAAASGANLGTLVPTIALDDGELVKNAVPARCDENGFLLIGDPPEMGPYVLPGNNYHVYDYPLFWANIRQDALLRTRSFLASGNANSGNSK